MSTMVSYLQARSSGIVYGIARSTRGPIKVGMAKNVAIRIRELQTGNPERLRLCCAIVVPLKCMFEAERHVHDLLTTHRRRGEWFYTHGTQIARAFQGVIDQGRHDASMLMVEARRAIASGCFDDVSNPHDAFLFDQEAALLRAARISADPAVAAGSACPISVSLTF
jgi:hypothetical protein